MSFNINRILIADDDERPRELLAHYLTSWGFQVTSCRDGLEAVRILESDNAPALALIDWMMPGLEGVEICRRVRNHPGRRPYIYIILLTGNDDVAAGLEAGADDFVRKPYEVDELKARLSVGQRVVGLERRLAEHIAMLRDTLEQVGQLPEADPICICPNCKQTRDSRMQWQSVESYLLERTGTYSLHELCPTCTAKNEAAAVKEESAAT